MKLLSCSKCNWAHVAITRKEAEDEIIKFNRYWNRLTQEDQMSFYNGKPATIGMYKECARCHGSYVDFRKTRKGEVPDGVTMTHIIDKDERS